MAAAACSASSAPVPPVPLLAVSLAIGRPSVATDGRRPPTLVGGYVLFLVAVFCPLLPAHCRRNLAARAACSCPLDARDAPPILPRPCVLLSSISLAMGRQRSPIGGHRPAPSTHSGARLRRYFGPASRPLCVRAVPARSPIARHRPLLFACALARLSCCPCCLLLSFRRSCLPARLCAPSFGPLLPSCRLS